MNARTGLVRLVAGLLGGVVTVALLIVGPIPAAVASDMSSGCAAVNELSWSGPGGLQDWSFAAGEQVRITAGEPHSSYAPPDSAELKLDGVRLDFVLFPGTLTYTFTEPTSGQFEFGTSPFGTAPTWTFSCTPAPATAVEADSPGPAPWYQSFARPTGETACITGWHPSWAQWPNGNRGGYVCDRTIGYDRGTGTWTNFG